jgi:acetyl esterase/lipase
MSVSLLGLVNLLSPKPARSHRVASGIAYGPHARQRLDVYRPKGADADLPLVVFLYGGAWNSGDRRDYSFVGRSLAARGFVVVVPDYRVLPEVEYPEFLVDCAGAVRWASNHAREFGARASRLAVAGHSAGAYNATMLALDPRYGVSADIRAVVGLSGPYDFYPFDIDISRRTFGAVADPQSTQPINHVTGRAPPMFLASADGDKLVYPRNTTALAARLRDNGVSVVEKHFAGGGHPTTLLELGSLLGGKTALLSDISAFIAAQTLVQSVLAAEPTPGL